MTYDIVVAGAGPVGLFLACELALAKCSVLVLERSECADAPLKRLPFGIRGLSAPTIEALYRRGLLGELQLHERMKNPHQNAKQGAQRQVGHFAGIPFLEGNVDASQWTDRLPSSTPTSLISEIEELESVLSHRAESLGVEILRGVGVTGFDQGETEVEVQAVSGIFRGKWLVGCDGARSIVRKSGDFDFVGTEPKFTGYSAQVEILDPEKLRLGRISTEAGMYMQSQPGYLVMAEFDGGAGHGSSSPTREHVQGVLRRVSETDVTVTALHAATTWTDRARQVTRYRDGRVFLAGDAAHIHSPLGGQGLNLGLGDAMNLGWKLAACKDGNGPVGLLDSYAEERHPVGEAVLNWSRAQVAIMGSDSDSRALNAVFRDLIETRDGATYFAGRVWGVPMQYDLGGGHRLVGRSAPNFEFESGVDLGGLMRDGRGVLLDFEGCASLGGFASDRVLYVCGPARDALGLRAVLVRPDGIVAWATEGPQDAEELGAVVERWFG